MADLIIRGMAMPGNCRECRFAGFGGIRCELNVCMFSGESQSLLSHERMSKCPLLPLPEKHGRLIDADALFQVIGQDTDRWLIDDISYIETDDAISAVYNAPTIVPAEGGTDDGN